MNFIFYIVAGAVSGIIAGMGMGGGTVLIPLLTMLTSLSQHKAQGVNLISFIPMAIVVLIIHVKNKLINFITWVENRYGLQCPIYIDFEYKNYLIHYTSAFIFLQLQS